MFLSIRLVILFIFWEVAYLHGEGVKSFTKLKLPYQIICPGLRKRLFSTVETECTDKNIASASILFSLNSRSNYTLKV